MTVVLSNNPSHLQIQLQLQDMSVPMVFMSVSKDMIILVWFVDLDFYEFIAFVS